MGQSKTLKQKKKNMVQKFLTKKKSEAKVKKDFCFTK